MIDLISAMEQNIASLLVSGCNRKLWVKWKIRNSVREAVVDEDDCEYDEAPRFLLPSPISLLKEDHLLESCVRGLRTFDHKAIHLYHAACIYYANQERAA